MGKEKETCCLVFPSSTKHKMRHFHVVVMQQWLRIVPKSMMHMQSCCFANLNLLLFCHARCRHRHHYLSSLIRVDSGMTNVIDLLREHKYFTFKFKKFKTGNFIFDSSYSGGNKEKLNKEVVCIVFTTGFQNSRITIKYSCKLTTLFPWLKHTKGNNFPFSSI